jgi:flagellar protein FliO/FliZ
MVSLGLVIGAVLVTGFVLRRLSPSLRQAGTLLKPVTQIAVGPKEKVAVIQFQGELLVIGITAHQVSLLTKGIAELTTPEARATTEKDLLNRWLSRLKPSDAAGKQVEERLADDCRNRSGRLCTPLPVRVRCRRFNDFADKPT